MHYQIVYMKRGFPLTTWASSAEQAHQLADSSAGLVIPWTCGSTPKGITENRSLTPAGHLDGTPATILRKCGENRHEPRTKEGDHEETERLQRVSGRREEPPRHRPHFANRKTPPNTCGATVTL